MSADLTPFASSISAERVFVMLDTIDTIRTQIHCGLWGVCCGFRLNSLQERDLKAQIALLADLDNLLGQFRAELRGEPSAQGALELEAAPERGRLN